MEKFKIWRPVRPSLNYQDNFYKRTKNGLPPTVVSQFFGENLACQYPNGSFVRFMPSGSTKCPEGTTSVYEKFGMLGHNGIDIPCRRGDPVYSAHDGVVSRMEGDKNIGYGIRVMTNEVYKWKSNLCRFETAYWHLIPLPIVREGQFVRTGDLLGFCDNTGYSSGDHLHFGLKPKSLDGNSNIASNNGYYGAIDPMPYLEEMDAFDKKLSRWDNMPIVKEEQKMVNRMIVRYYRTLIAIKFGGDPVNFSEEMLNSFQNKS